MTSDCNCQRELLIGLRAVERVKTLSTQYWPNYTNIPKIRTVGKYGNPVARGLRYVSTIFVFI